MSETRVALVTGANKGIGYAIARQLVARGDITVLVGARDLAGGQRAAAELAAVPVQLDVTDEASIAAAAKWIEEEYGRLDILVNNAGILVDAGVRPSEATADLVRRTYETNVFGVLAVTHAMLPLLRRAPAARIVNMSSSLASMTLSTDPDTPQSQLALVAYNSSKAAVNGVTVAYANELRDTPIKVNAADPGYCATDMNGGYGDRTAEQGAIAAVRLATLDSDGPTGSFQDEDGTLPW